MFVYRAGGNTQEAQAGGIFTNLSYDDKQAFFSLLDEYFASRPHLSGGGGGGNSSVGAGVTSPPPPSRSSGPPAANPASRPAAHASPPSVSYTPSPPAAPSSGGPAAFVNSGLGKVAGNQHLSGALGKIGAGGFAKSMDKKFNAPQSRHGTGMTSPNKPPTPGGLSTGKSWGHIDMSSGGAAVKSMWSNDPNYHKPPSAPVPTALPPPSRGGAVLPPPSRHVDAAEPAAEPAPAYSAAGRVKALYDYEGGDDTDLPLQAGQIVTIVDKTSDDWWTCKDDNGKQGLVPANYVEEM